MEGYLSVREAAGRLGVSHSLVARWIRAGRLRAERIGYAYVVPAAEVERVRRERGPDGFPKGRPRKAA